MNFVAHAVVAGWRRSEAGFAFGAMVPDFCTMARAKIAYSTSPAVRSGIDFHHHTDEVFHALPTFIDLCKEALRELLALGVRRGSARAVSHVGTELVIDGLLLRQAEARETYLTALGVAGRDDHGLVFENTAETDRFRQLMQHLHARGLPTGYRDPSGLTSRLRQALSARPRLSLDDGDGAVVEAWLPSAMTRTAGRLPALLDELTLGLSSTGDSSTAEPQLPSPTIPARMP